MSFLPSLLASRWFARFALLASLLVFAGVIAHWVVGLATPPSAARPAVSPLSAGEAARAVSSRHLFGVADKAAPVGNAAVTDEAGSVRLLGVASSGPQGGGFAIVSLDGKAAVAVVQGQEIAPGMRLEKVSASEIEYRRGGQLRRLALTERKPVGSSAPAGAGAAFRTVGPVASAAISPAVTGNADAERSRAAAVVAQSQYPSPSATPAAPAAAPESRPQKVRPEKKVPPATAQ